jgi:uncharacterized protein
VTRPSLLDVNLLIALLDPTHTQHEYAHDWFHDNRSRGWATCALTENGFVRVLSRDLPGRPADRPSLLLRHLKAFCASGDHVFWNADISLRDAERFDLSAAAHSQLTDIYLLGLAQAHGGVFATFDRSIPVNAVVGATRDTLEVISG